MATRRKPQLLVRLTLFSVLFSQMLAWPLFEAPFLNIPSEGANELDPALLTLNPDVLPNAFAENNRNARHTEDILPSDYERLLGQFPAKRHVESLIGKRDSDDVSGDSGPNESQLDDQQAHLEKQDALRKYLQYLRDERLFEEK